MASPITIKLGLDPDSLAGFRASLKALAPLVQACPEVADILFGAMDAGDEWSRFEACPAADGAGERLFALKPSDRFLEVVRAIRAIDPDGGIVEDIVHGWPILSLVCANASMTEAGGASSLARGGPAR